jgi:hypothetical protein
MGRAPRRLSDVASHARAAGRGAVVADAADPSGRRAARHPHGIARPASMFGRP